ncbi:hypothetical protein BV20DRAFT_1113283 [Pilatotrama ljubarskyi]|nr:hypothetical protein BV20DRAFT_1113283 [Pilatotrama ljubarskyi]
MSGFSAARRILSGHVRTFRPAPAGPGGLQHKGSPPVRGSRPPLSALHGRLKLLPPTHVRMGDRPTYRPLPPCLDYRPGEKAFLGLRVRTLNHHPASKTLDAVRMTGAYRPGYPGIIRGPPPARRTCHDPPLAASTRCVLGCVCTLLTRLYSLRGPIVNALHSCLSPPTIHLGMSTGGGVDDAGQLEMILTDPLHNYALARQIQKRYLARLAMAGCTGRRRPSIQLVDRGTCSETLRCHHPLPRPCLTPAPIGLSTRPLKFGGVVDVSVHKHQGGAWFFKLLGLYNARVQPRRTTSAACCATTTRYCHWSLLADATHSTERLAHREHTHSEPLTGRGICSAGLGSDNKFARTASHCFKLLLRDPAQQ